MDWSALIARAIKLLAIALVESPPIVLGLLAASWTARDAKQVLVQVDLVVLAVLYVVLRSTIGSIWFDLPPYVALPFRMARFVWRFVAAHHDSPIVRDDGGS